ncbi:hypothetical protein HYN48_03705 [Flavobacterium magnum]|uniref:Uncharacterized protein n=1 Tax=Flavobacterium magnum TaxID=2162713 RepID=A0A2S0RCE0_9FLAO|nr:hypothetical protein [Flavobacterium magnum]AWA29264.1 hypothetical protein HYN48_03705 [Flavobacterium magnum]
MSNTPKKVSDDQEIDLAQISKKINSGFKSVGTGIFKSIRFFIKNAIIIVILFAIGVGLGIFMDSNQKKYNHEIIVLPNFGSSDYLYSKIELINSKISEGDTAYLKSMGLKFPKNISKLKIEPIVDPYNFVRDREENMELLRLMAENGSIDKVLKDKITSKNYSFHLITFSTKGKATDANTIQPLLAALNDNEYLKIIQREAVENVKQKMQYNEQTINQINALLDNFSNTDGKGTKNSNLIYYSEDTQIDEVLKSKYNLVTEQGNRRIELINYQKVIKDISVVSNIETPSSETYIFPLLLIILFICGKLFISFYRKQSLKFRENTAN